VNCSRSRPGTMSILVEWTGLLLSPILTACLWQAAYADSAITIRHIDNAPAAQFRLRADPAFLECTIAFEALPRPEIAVWSLYAFAGPIVTSDGQKVLSPDRIEIRDISGQWIPLSEPRILLIGAGGGQPQPFEVALRTRRDPADRQARYTGELRLFAVPGPPAAGASVITPLALEYQPETVIVLDVPLGPDVVLTVDPGDVAASTNFLKNGIPHGPIALDCEPQGKRVDLLVNDTGVAWTVSCSAQPLVHQSEPTLQIPTSRLFVACETTANRADEGAGAGYSSLQSPVDLTTGNQTGLSLHVSFRILIQPDDRAGKYVGTVTFRAVAGV
jgi:hypothetical protein